MARWRVRRHDGEGVTELGPLPGRMGRKGTRQHLQGTAVRDRHPGPTRGVPAPVSDATREALRLRIADGSAIAHEADGVLFTAEQVRA